MPATCRPEEIKPATNVLDAARLMANTKAYAVGVVSPTGESLGTIREHDLVTFFARGQNLFDTSAGELLRLGGHGGTPGGPSRRPC